MIELPYDTRIGKDNKIEKVITQLIKARTDFSVADSSLIENLINVPFSEVPNIYLVTSQWQNVDYFTQVIRLPHEWKDDEFIYFIDVRQMTTVTRDGELKWKSSSDRLFTLTRLFLTIDWAEGDIVNFFTSIEGAGTIYTNWITRAIGRVYPITNTGNLSTQMRVTALAGIFFWSQFYSDDSPDLNDPSMARSKAVTVTQISKAARVPSNVVEDLVELTGGRLKTVDDFVKALAEHSESLALENITVAKLFQALSMTWFGANSSEHAGYAVEYPPTFYAMVLTALKDNSYRKTVIGEIVKDNARNQGLNNLATTFKKLMNI